MYMLTESKNNIDNISKGSIAKLNIYMTNTINCVYYFLIFSLFWTLFMEVKNAMNDYIKHKNIPFVTNFQLTQVSIIHRIHEHKVQLRGEGRSSK